MKLIFKITMNKFLSTFLIIALTLFWIAPSITVEAASLTGLSDTMSSAKKDTLSSHVIRFTTPTGAGDVADTIIITFPADFDFSTKSIGTVTFQHGATTGLETTETLAASASATEWGAAFSGTENRILTLSHPTNASNGDVAAADKVVITYTSANATNPSSANTYSIAITGTFGDTGSITVPILDDDQVAVSATVAQSLTFSISDNSIGFGTLSAAGARYATGDTAGDNSETQAHTLIAGTNASSGYTITVQGATLTSGLNTIDAIGGSNTASSVGSEQFGIRLTASGGDGDVSAPYADAGFAYAADGSTSDEVAASTVASADTTYSVRYLANIASETEAGSYTATLNYSGTANF
jgi:hypothetical protein